MTLPTPNALAPACRIAPVGGLTQSLTRSVNYRYVEDELYVYEHGRPKHIAWSPVEVLSALDCYECQACEHPGWSTSQAQAFCDALRSTLIVALPGYDAGSWAITADQ